MAREKTLTIKIAGDAAQLNRSLGSAGKDLDRFGKHAETTGSRFSSSMKLAGAAAAGALAVGLKQSVSAAVEAEKSQARLEAQLKASGIAYKAHAAEIEHAIQATSKLSGLDDEDLADSFTNLVRVTGDVSEALKLNSLAADLARAKHIDVAKAGEIVGKVANGNVNALKRYGVTVEKGATVQEALAAAQRKFAGQAEAYGKTTAGAADRASVGFENLQEVVGARLTPVLAKVANKLADLANWASENPGKFKAIAITIGAVATAIGTISVVTKVAAGVKALRTAMIALNASFLANPVVLTTAAIVAFGAALVIAYKKSATFRSIVAGAFQAITKAVDTLLGGLSSMLSALGHIPKFGWARDAANAIDKARESVRGFANGLNKIHDKTVTLKVKFQGVTVKGQRVDTGDILSLGRAAGGIIPGTGDKDTVPMLGTPGEFVIRKKIVEKFGPTFFTAINDGQEPQRFTAGGIIARANRLDGQHRPYAWGGGHGDGGKRGWDCSGAVSYALGVSPRVSGQFTSWGSPGPGNPMDTKVFANAQHVFAVLNGRGWGTSKENPGGGPGWLSYNYRPGFTIRHLNDSAKSGAGDAQEASESGKRKLGIRPGKTTSGGPAAKTVAGVQPFSAPDSFTADTPDAPAWDQAQVQGDLISQSLGDVDLQERAGVLTPEQARAQRISMVQSWLGGALGPLDQRQTWELMAQLRDAQGEATQAASDLAEQMKGLTEQVAQSNAIAQTEVAVGLREARRAIADMVSGQLGARVGPRALLPGNGELSRLF